MSEEIMVQQQEYGMAKHRFIEIFKNNIKRDGADKLLEYLDKSDFFTAPASAKHHLNVVGGLCMHSIHVYERLLSLYSGEYLKDTPFSIQQEKLETISIVGLLHDLCKIGCYIQEPKNQKTYDPEKVSAAERWQVKHDQLGDFVWETMMGYKFEDSMPYGHGEKSVYIISGFMKLTREEAFAIRYHMGPWQDGEKNNAGKAFELYPMAFMAHMADMQATYLDEKEN